VERARRDRHAQLAPDFLPGTLPVRGTARACSRWSVRDRRCLGAPVRFGARDPRGADVRGLVARISGVERVPADQATRWLAVRG